MLGTFASLGSGILGKKSEHLSCDLVLKSHHLELHTSLRRARYLRMRLRSSVALSRSLAAASAAAGATQLSMRLALLLSVAVQAAYTGVFEI